MVSLCRMWEDLVSIVFIIGVAVKILRYEFNMLLCYNFPQANIQPKNNIYLSRKIKLRFKMKKKIQAAVVIFIVNAFSYSYPYRLML